MSNDYNGTGLEVAVIGMDGRFPGARDIYQFWDNLKNGVESVTFYLDEELLEAGVDSIFLENPNYVKSGGGILENKEYFDAFFFGYSATEAETMDPQVRIFHECTWNALSDAGYDSFSYNGLIGLYAGASSNLNWEALSLIPGRSNALGSFATRILTDRDHLCTRISYLLNLRGPAVVVKTACSTSLVAVHMACQAILNGECDMALAGGGTIIQLENSGYLYQENMIMSPDGHCRAFDAQAKGTIGGNGVGVVLLKRFKEAIKDRDHIYALIKGTAVNNDGIQRAGYTAPGINGQSQVIREALEIAEVGAESISYVEAHGTGTIVGDPIEIESLSMAFNTNKKQFCGIGSVKTNVGHMDSAAGVTSLIKTVLALKHKLLPPSLHFEVPNPKIDFKNSPFYVITAPTEWKGNGYPLRAGVSSFGIGGTNAHVILEEAPKLESSSESKKWELLLISAKSRASLEKLSANLLIFFENNPNINLADVAYTLQLGRRTLPYRRFVICSDVDGAIDALSYRKTGKVISNYKKDENRSAIFLFSGLGSQYLNMGRELYNNLPLFREEMDRCFNTLKNLVDYDLKEILYPGDTPRPADTVGTPEIPEKINLNRIEIAQLVIFVLGYALARLLMKLGIIPHAMIGYSFGEYTAACLSGVFSLEDALKLVVIRGKLIDRISNGLMLSVPLPVDQLKPLLNNELSLAIDNGPSCIVAGKIESITAFEKSLNEKRYMCMRLPGSYAIHSKMMEPILMEFEDHIKNITLNKPKIPYISNVTGQWITVQEAMDPGYWSRHLRETVRFADGIRKLMKEPNPLFIEIGPGRDLSILLVRYKEYEKKNMNLAVNLIKPSQQERPDDYYLLSKLGELWLNGVVIDWKGLYPGERRYRVSLPGYPFESMRYWVDMNSQNILEMLKENNSFTSKKTDIADWFYIPTWKRAVLSTPEEPVPGDQKQWLLFIDGSTLGNQLKKRLEMDKQYVTIVRGGATFEVLKKNEYCINISNDNDYSRLFEELVKIKKVPQHIVHLWGLTGNDEHRSKKGITFDDLEQNLDLHLFSLMHIAQAIGNNSISNDLQFAVITNHMQSVTGDEILWPEKATSLAPIKIIPYEYSNIKCLSLDIIHPGSNRQKVKWIIDNLLKEFSVPCSKWRAAAYRGYHRWIESYEPIPFNYPSSKDSALRLKKGGIYLVTGGFGGMGFVIADNLVTTLSAKVILVDLLEFPPGEKLEPWLTSDERKREIEEKKQKIREWEDKGVEIQVHDADVCNYQQMREIISQAEKRLGKINGVIHTAGLIDYAGVIQRRTGQMTEMLLAAKIKGTLVLDELLKHHDLDFMVLFSSIGNLFPVLKFGQVGYNAGNEFLDLFSIYKRKQGQFTISINWNDWNEVGMAVRAARERDESESLLSISPEEGIDVFQRILENNFCRVIVSPNDLVDMMAYLNNFEEGNSIIASASADENREKLYARPELDTDYVPPGNEVEKSIVEVWQKLFGIQQIGIEDDFFDLGGDSLMATTMISRVNQQFEVKIPLAQVFSSPTIQKLVVYIGDGIKKHYKNLPENMVLIKEGSKNAKNFLFVHTGIGEVQEYTELCHRLTSDFNYWGITANKLDNWTPINTTIEEIAADYIRKFQCLQTHGPYYISGWCTGALIAYEMTRQLEQMNEEVRFLGLIEISLESPSVEFSYSLESDLQLISNQFQNEELNKRVCNIFEFNQLWPVIIDYLEKEKYDIEDFRKMLPEFAPRAYPNFEQLGYRELIYYFNIGRGLERAEGLYSISGRIKAPTYVFEAHISLVRGKINWNNYCHNFVRSNKIEGDHFTMFQMPDVMEFARIIDNELQEVLNSQGKGE